MIPLLTDLTSAASPLAASAGPLPAAAPGAGGSGGAGENGSDFAGLLGAALFSPQGDGEGGGEGWGGATLVAAGPSVAPARAALATGAAGPGMPSGKSLPPSGAELPLPGACDRAELQADPDPLAQARPRPPVAAAWLAREQTLAEAPRAAASVLGAGRGLRASDASIMQEMETGDADPLPAPAAVPALAVPPADAATPPLTPMSTLEPARSDLSPLIPATLPAEPAPVASASLSEVRDPATALSPLVPMPALVPAIPLSVPAASPAPLVRAAAAPMSAKPMLPTAAPAAIDEAGDTASAPVSPADLSPQRAEALSETPAPSASAPAPTATALAAVAPAPASTISDRIEAPRPAPTAPAGAQQEQSIAQVGDLREAMRSARPEMTLRHAEFGFVSVRLEQAAPEQWRAVLAARDPGFVPAVQAALDTRAIAASADSPAAQNGTSDQRYGASPNGGQGGHSPHLSHSGGRDSDAAPDHRRPSTAAALAARAEGEDEGAASRTASPGGLFA